MEVLDPGRGKFWFGTWQEMGCHITDGRAEKGSWVFSNSIKDLEV